jgi:hypothetical protein
MMNNTEKRQALAKMIWAELDNADRMDVLDRIDPDWRGRFAEVDDDKVSYDMDRAAEYYGVA